MTHMNNPISKHNRFLNSKYFTLILWNPVFHLKDKIISEIQNVVNVNEIIINKNKLSDFVFDIYKLDTRCTHHVVLPPKIKKLKNYNDHHLLVRFEIKNPTFDKNNICREAVNLKETIRKKYKSSVKDYIRDIIIHVADNYEQSEYIWNNYGNGINTNKINNNVYNIIVQNAHNPLRYKIAKKDVGKGWTTIFTMNVYNKKIENTEEYLVYRASNPRKYCLSKNKINDGVWEYCFSFYSSEDKIDNRLPFYQSYVNDKKPNDFKNKIKKQHIDFYSPLGNIIYA